MLMLLFHFLSLNLFNLPPIVTSGRVAYLCSSKRLQSKHEDTLTRGGIPAPAPVGYVIFNAVSPDSHKHTLHT